MTLMVAAVVLVGLSVAFAVLVGGAALVGVGLGAAATRIMYSEVVQTRWESACERAEQARTFQAAMERSHADHQAYSALVARRIGDRDRAIGELGGTVRRLERRIDEAETRVRREARRANEAQERLAAVLDEVLGTVDPDADADAVSDVLAEVLAGRSNPPTIADLMEWDAHTHQTAPRPANASDRAVVA